MSYWADLVAPRFIAGALIALLATPSFVAAAEAPATPAPTAQAPASAPAPAPAREPLPTVTLPAPLQRVLTDYETAWRNKDAAALAALFAEDGFVLSSGSPPVRGRAEIEKHYAGAGGPLALRAIAFGIDGALAWIVGGFARNAGEPDSGKFTLTLRKDKSGRWLINSDMDNGNTRR